MYRTSVYIVSDTLIIAIFIRLGVICTFPTPIAIPASTIVPPLLYRIIHKFTDCKSDKRNLSETFKLARQFKRENDLLYGRYFGEKQFSKRYRILILIKFKKNAVPPAKKMSKTPIRHLLSYINIIIYII